MRKKIFGRGRPSSQEPPTQPGNYRWVDEAGEIVYVGETNNLRRRRGEHRRSQSEVGSVGQRFLWQASLPDASADDRRAVERQKIASHKPRLNRRAGGGGRK